MANPSQRSRWSIRSLTLLGVALVVVVILVTLLPPVYRWDTRLVVLVVGNAVNVARRLLGG